MTWHEVIEKLISIKDSLDNWDSHIYKPNLDTIDRAICFAEGEAIKGDILAPEKVHYGFYGEIIFDRFNQKNNRLSFLSDGTIELLIMKGNKIVNRKVFQNGG